MNRLLTFRARQSLADKMLVPHNNATGTVWTRDSKRLQELNNPFELLIGDPRRAWSHGVRPQGIPIVG
jgi:hypothetical protein